MGFYSCTSSMVKVSYSTKLMIMAAEIDILMQQFSHTKKDIWYGFRWTFRNEQWVDLIDYKKQDMYIFRVWRGAWFVKQYPILQWLFDEVLLVIAKLRIYDVSTLYGKNIGWLLKLLEQAPHNIRYDAWYHRKMS